MASFVRAGHSGRAVPADRRAPRGDDRSDGSTPSDTPSARGGAPRRVEAPSAFVLYVEGPRDHDLLRIWANRLSRQLARSLEPCGFILGGRRPARAVEDFRERGGAEAGVRGLVVLDRDHHDESDELLAAEPGLELFTWTRRHIESYVLVPQAIRRVLENSIDATRLDYLMDDLMPHPEDEPACRKVNAKRLLDHKGPLARGIGRALAPGEIARAMRAEELHPDVLDLFARVRTSLGLAEPSFEVVRRSAPE
jgi:hypothetical protein